MSIQQIVEEIEHLSPEARREAEVFIHSLRERQQRKIVPPTFSWEGGLNGLKDEYTPVELQKGKTPYDRIKHLLGVLDGPGDLSTNPKYMEGYGE